jgi:hypothetical protein
VGSMNESVQIVLQELLNLKGGVTHVVGRVDPTAEPGSQASVSATWAPARRTLKLLVVAGPKMRRGSGVWRFRDRAALAAHDLVVLMYGYSLEPGGTAEVVDGCDPRKNQFRRISWVENLFCIDNEYSVWGEFRALLTEANLRAAFMNEAFVHFREDPK